ncbi:hypothetical protein ACSS7Z_04705 [Microbacterium sp. A82]|uniref:hypothetical protein n=1 Tax=Microbacterium sp. A82 TaxID=3450452 RepID=UPI003F2BF13A
MGACSSADGLALEAGWLRGDRPSGRDAGLPSEAENPNYQVAIDQLDVASGPDVVRRFVPKVVPEAKGSIQAVYSCNVDSGKAPATVQANLEPAIEKIRARYGAKVGA